MRPHLDYCAPAYSPWTPGDKEILENVQRRAIGMVSNFKGLRGDLLQAYRVLNKVDDVDPSKWFDMTQERNGAMSMRHTKGHLNVEKREAKGDIRHNFWLLKPSP